MATANEPGKSPERATDAFPRWVWPAGAGGLLVLGWVFILAENSFHLTAPVVFVCLGYGAAIAAVYTLFRTGAAAASAAGDDDDAGWGRPVGARAELEREKKALLKAIKEAEFDLQMGKLSKADAEAMIAVYRGQALAVIREIERKDGGDASVREQIEREVRARLEVAKAKKAADADRRPAGKKGKKAQAAPAAQAPKKAEEAAAKAEPEAEEEAKAPAAAAAAAAEEAKAEEAAAKADGAADDEIDQPDGTAATAEPAAVDPSNAEPRGQEAAVAKEATS